MGGILNKPIHGVGVNNGKYPAWVDGKHTKEYKLWISILRRCYDVKCQQRSKNASYANCSVSENFKNYSYFYEWCQKQIGFGNEDWQLDKDILLKDNKVYSEDTCCFVPPDVNGLLIRGSSRRGRWPIGVHQVSRGSFRAMCKADRKRIDLGCRATPEEAFELYKMFKEAYVKGFADKYKSQLDPRAYHALMNYQVEITD